MPQSRKRPTRGSERVSKRSPASADPSAARSRLVRISAQRAPKASARAISRYPTTPPELRPKLGADSVRQSRSESAGCGAKNAQREEPSPLPASQQVRGRKEEGEAGQNEKQGRRGLRRRDRDPRNRGLSAEEGQNLPGFVVNSQGSQAQWTSGRPGGLVGSGEPRGPRCRSSLRSGSPVGRGSAGERGTGT